MKEDNQKSLITILVILIIIVMAVLGFFVYRIETEKRKDNQVTEIDPGQKIDLENDNRVYPLEIKYYNGISGCYLTTDGKCALVYADHYKDDIYYDDFVFKIEEVEVKEEDYLGSYKCNTYTCMTYEVDTDSNLAVIYDNEIVIFNYKDDEIFNSGLKFDSKDYNNRIENALDDINVDIFSNTMENGILLDVCYKSKKENNLYSVSKKKFLLKDNYSSISLVEGDKSGLIYMVSNDKVSNLMKNDIVLYEFDGKYFCSTDENIKYLNCSTLVDDKKTIVLNKEKYEKVEEYDDIINYQVIDDYIVYQSDADREIDDQFVEVRKRVDLSLVKKIEKVNDLEKLTIKDKVFYVGNISLQDDDGDLSTVVLDDSFDVIISSTSLPSNKSGLFSVDIDTEKECFVIRGDKEYLFDLKGKRIN